MKKGKLRGAFILQHASEQKLESFWIHVLNIYNLAQYFIEALSKLHNVYLGVVLYALFPINLAYTLTITCTKISYLDVNVDKVQV